MGWRIYFYLHIRGLCLKQLKGIFRYAIMIAHDGLYRCYLYKLNKIYLSYTEKKEILTNNNDFFATKWECVHDGVHPKISPSVSRTGIY